MFLFAQISGWSKFLGEAEPSDYVTYDLGWYPRIKPGRGKIHGEVYEIDLGTLAL